MAQKLKFGNGTWATKEGSTLAYNDENGNYKPLPFSVSRASTATRVNKQGLIEVVGQNKARVDYSETSNGALLLEPSRTNSIASSEDINTGWTYTNVAALINQTTSPDGNITADSIIPDATSGQHSINSINITSSGSFTLSAFVKAGELTKVAIRESANTGSYASFDLSSGVKIEDNVSGASFIQSYGNGWYRIGVTGTFSGTIRLGINALSNSYTTGNPSSGATFFSGNSSDKLFCWGMQCELGATYATSYIPTSSSSVTRVADAANNCGNSAVFNDSEGVLYAQTSFSDRLSAKAISISSGSYDNRVLFYLSTSGSLSAYSFVSGVNQCNIPISNYDFQTSSKLALKYKTNDFSFWINGFKVGIDTSGTTFASGALKELSFDANGSGADIFYGKTKELGYYDAALTDAELEYLTSYRSLAEMVTELNLNQL